MLFSVQPHNGLVPSMGNVTPADSKVNLAASLKSGWLICMEELLKSRFRGDAISGFRLKKELRFEKPNIQRTGLTRQGWV